MNLKSKTVSIVDVLKVKSACPGQASAVRTFEVPDSIDTVDCDILIVGGGTAGVAAALAATEDGDMTICFTEETDWLGGQMTAQGVPITDDGRNFQVETSGSNRSYQKFRQSIRNYYKKNFKLTPLSEKRRFFNPGNCWYWVSQLTFQPKVAVSLIEERIAKPKAAGRLKLFLRHVPVLVGRLNEAIDKVTMVDLETGKWLNFRAKYFIDATELGDLLALSGTPYRYGSECQDETGEPSAPSVENPDQVQDYTYPFMVEFVPSTNNTIAKPPLYDRFNKEGKFSLLNYKMFEHGTKTNSEGVIISELMPFWTYRRILDKSAFDDVRIPHDLAVINWYSNDFQEHNIIDKEPKVVSEYLSLAKALSLSFLYWLQTEAPRDDGGKGYPELRLASDALGTADGLSKYPYIRESRRGAAVTVIKEQDIKPASNVVARARIFDDSTGIGFFPVDIHGKGVVPGTLYPTKPFQIPLSALVLKSASNLILSCKNIGATHITSAAYRLHPIEWGIGEASALLAKFAIERQIKPIDVLENAQALGDFQYRLIRLGVPLYWYDDLPTDHPHFEAVQLLAVLDVMRGEPQHLHFFPDSEIGNEQARQIVDGAVQKYPALKGIDLPESLKTRSQFAFWLYTQFQKLVFENQLNRPHLEGNRQEKALSETVKTQIPIYVYLHFHWDREWFLTASTARALLLDRVRKTLAALESGELPSFYLDGQAIVLEDLIEIEPEFAPRISAAMSLGKLSAGPWYVLPDQSLVGGESLVRNLKLGIEITRRFGDPTMTGYNPDTFCHVQDLPRILQGMGISTAIVLRGVPPLSGTNVFWWDSPDGSRVLTYLLNKGLTHQVFHKTADGQEIAKDLMARWDLGAADDTTAPMLYSAGGEGMQPPGDLANKLASVNANLPKNCEARVVSIDQFLASFEHWAADKDLPEIVGELRDNRSISERFPAYILDGVSSTRLYLKRDNALSEHRLVRMIEPFFALLHAKGIMAYPEGELKHAWKLLIQNHPHDSICGCSIDIVHQEMRTRTQQLHTFLDGLEMLAAEKIAEQANIGTNHDGKLKSALPVTTGLQPIDPGNGYDRLLIQNTSGYAHRAPVKMTWYIDPDKPSSLPSVQVQLESQTDCPNLLFHSGGGFYYKKVRRFDGWLYPESEVPAMGSTESRWIGAKEITSSNSQSAKTVDEPKDVTCASSALASEIDNGLLKAKVDGAGNLVVICTANGKEKEIALRHDIYDVGDGGDSYNFDPLLNDTEIVAKFVSMSEGKRGPLLCSLLLIYAIDIPEGLDTKTVSEDDLGKGRSKNTIKHTIQTEITLKKGVPILFFNTTFENHSADHRLSVRLHTGAQVKESWSECHFSIARRLTPPARPELPVPVGHEVLPESFFCQRFFISQGQVFFNVGLPEYRTADDYAEITLLRSVSWLSRGRLRTRGGGAGPWDATPEANCFGANQCEYAWAFLGEPEDSRLDDEQIIQSYKLADLFEGRLVAHAIGNFTGAGEHPLITITNPAIYLASSFVDHGKLYLRLLNVTAAPQNTNLNSQIPSLSVAKVSLLGEHPQLLPTSKDTNDAITLNLSFGQNELLTIAFDLLTDS